MGSRWMLKHKDTKAHRHSTPTPCSDWATTDHSPGTVFWRDHAILRAMSNSDILSKADRALRPVLKELGRFPVDPVRRLLRGAQTRRHLWLEINVLGSSGLAAAYRSFCRFFDTKLAGTDCRVDCLLELFRSGGRHQLHRTAGFPRQSKSSGPREANGGAANP